MVTTTKKVIKKKVPVKSKKGGHATGAIHAQHEINGENVQELVDENFSGVVTELDVEQVAEVEVMLGFLVKTADFENVRGHVLLRIPCDAKKIDQAYDKAKGWVDEKLESLHGEVMEMIDD